MSNTLVLCHAIPEDVSFYLVPDEKLPLFMRAVLMGAHNTIGNSVGLSDEERRLNRLALDMVCPKPEYLDSETPTELGCCLHPFKCEKAPEPQTFTAVYYFGFYL